MGDEQLKQTPTLKKQKKHINFEEITMGVSIVQLGDRNLMCSCPDLDSYRED
jgi:hypothetical protein